MLHEEKKLLIEKRNSEIFLRPRFSITLEENYELLLDRFSNQFKNKTVLFRGSVVDGHVFISVPKKEEHFWSPQLHLEFIKVTETTTVLKGLFGPKPQVWTFFMFLHFILGALFVGFGVLLYANISLEKPVFLPVVMLLVVPFLWILLYVLGKIGKDTGKPQMKKLHHFMIENI
ncbi:GTP-binding protein [uncultured Polaribacter sp.]|uniref:GTP-binding protein n=1 Tax=uncultured Polaribacter sp. TaxID=174711 RepID=UPI002613CFD4|nr:GTP-binding protein [uncultured Polaribacter sp.]